MPSKLVNLYPLFKKIAFSMDPEWVHERTLSALKKQTKPGKAHWMVGDVPEKPVECMGLSFRNPIGLAAGMDKNGACVDGFASLGFGFVEVGTVTPRPQPGNPKPRLFRLPEHEAIINRMGFNNHGVAELLENVASVQFKGPLGINIGKNFDTPLEDAAADYRICMEAVYSRADYIAVNISSPNTKNLRDLQKGEAFGSLLSEIADTRSRLTDEQGIRKPIAVKIAPDMDADQVRAMADALLEAGMDAVIATNTTLDRSRVKGHPHAEEAGGLSGAPVRESSTRVISLLNEHLSGSMPIIGVGGIFTPADAKEKLDAGATLLQMYTGLIYQGPRAVADILKGI